MPTHQPGGETIPAALWSLEAARGLCRDHALRSVRFSHRHAGRQAGKYPDVAAWILAFEAAELHRTDHQR
jgi:hypothetical protein